MFHECLFISPDLDGHRAPNRALTLIDPENCKAKKTTFQAKFESVRIKTVCPYYV
jgi:hypothetical protein